MSARAALTLSYAFRYTRSYFTLRHTRSTNTLSRHAPRPSIDNLQPCASTASVNVSAVP